MLLWLENLSYDEIDAAIVGVGTSTPELAVSFIGALNGNADVAIGNVVGSNIFNVFGILGLTAVFFPVTFGRENLKFDIPFCAGISVILTLMFFNFFTATDNFSCDVFVDNSVLIAKSFGVSDSFISLTLIACGTSLPELAASIAAAVKKNTSMILGLCAQVSPLTSASIGVVDFLVMVAAVLVLFMCFVAYNWYLISNQIF